MWDPPRLGMEPMSPALAGQFFTGPPEVRTHILARKLRVCLKASVAKSCPILCDLVDCSTPGFPVLRYLSVALIHVH